LDNLVLRSISGQGHKTRYVQENFSATPQSRFQPEEGDRPLQFPNQPSVNMPRSQTPALSCHHRLLMSRNTAFQCLQTVGFPAIIQISRLNSTACLLDPSSFTPRLATTHVEFTTTLPTVALGRWELHPLADNSEFQRTICSYPNASDLFWTHIGISGEITLPRSPTDPDVPN